MAEPTVINCTRCGYGPVRHKGGNFVGKKADVKHAGLDICIGLKQLEQQGRKIRIRALTGDRTIRSADVEKEDRLYKSRGDIK